MIHQTNAFHTTCNGYFFKKEDYSKSDQRAQFSQDKHHMKGVQFAFILTQLAAWLSLADANDAPTCSVEEVEPDPNLHEMSFDLGYGLETFHAYVQPDISSFTRGEYTTAKTPFMKGHACKFFNMSPEQIRLLW